MEFCDLAVDVLTDLEELLLKTLSVALFQHIIDATGKGMQSTTFYYLLAE